MTRLADMLRAFDIRPTPQRLEVARVVFEGEPHATAEGVFEAVRDVNPTLSRATVYNTLNLMAERGLVIARVLEDRATVYDAVTTPHHHLLDEATGDVLDIPWDALRVSGLDAIEGYEIHDVQVVLRGRRRDDPTSD